MVHCHSKACFKEAVAIEDLLQQPTSTERICTEETTKCENYIRIKFPDSPYGGFFQRLGTTDSTLIAFITGSSAALTLILVGIVLGILR